MRLLTSEIVTGLLLAILLNASGCQYATFRANNADYPDKYKIKSEHVVVHSDVKLDSDHPLMDELLALRGQIGQTVELELSDRKVEVYLFEGEESYHKFLANHYPGLPPRRAYFVGTSKKLAIYAVWSDRIREDMRHEFTHGVLNGTLAEVPMWMDEGFAEYFELPGVAGIPRADYLNDLSLLVQNGWKPNLQRLEHLDSVGEMQRLDYAESWAWVHWLLHNNVKTRAALLRYAQQTSGRPSLYQELRQITPDPNVALLEWIRSSR